MDVSSRFAKLALIQERFPGQLVFEQRVCFSVTLWSSSSKSILWEWPSQVVPPVWATHGVYFFAFLRVPFCSALLDSGP